MINASQAVLLLCLSGKGSASASAVNPRGKELRLIYICAEPHMGAVISAFLWEGVPEIGMEHGEGKIGKEGKTMCGVIFRWSPPGKGGMHS